MSTIGAVRISELNTLDTITDGTKIKIPISKDDSNKSDPDWVSYSVNANVLSYFMENSLGLNDVDSKKGLRSQVIDLQSKFDRTLLRNEVGYFSGEVVLSEGQNLSVISRVPTIKTGEFMFCKRIKASNPNVDIYAGFVYRVKPENTSDYYYYYRGPAEFPYNRPSINGIAINLTDGCAYVVDGDELKKFIPAATTSAAGLLLAEDKIKLNNYASMFSYNPVADNSYNGLMSVKDKNKLDACVTTQATPYAAGLMSAADKRKLDACVISPATPSADGLMLAEDKSKLNNYATAFRYNPPATTSYNGLMSTKDKIKLNNYATAFRDNPPATTSYNGLMTAAQVNKLNKALYYAVGYFDDILNIDEDKSIILDDPADPASLNKGGKVMFCKRIKRFGSMSTYADFVYFVGGKYYSIIHVIDALEYPVPFKGSIAINRSDGCAYVFNSKDGTLKKLISEATPSATGLMTPEVLTRLNNIESRLAALEGTATTS